MAKKRVHRPEGSRPIPPPRKKSAPGHPRDPSGSGLSPRGRFEKLSRPILLRMQALPGFLIPVTLGILLFFGLTLKAAWSGILLVLIATFLFWLTAVAWPRITTGSRVLRLVVDLVVLVLGVVKLLGRL
jgi:Family of unknown function (DUF6703)